jgi:hypothetical protein
VLSDQLARLAAAGIELLPISEIETHFMFYRDGFAALVERTPGGFGSAGGAGLLTDKGFAALVWRGGKPFFIGKGFEQPGSGAQVEALRRFADDLENAIRSR